MDNVESVVLDLLKELQPNYDFEQDKDFIENGYLDSFDVVTLVTELEEKFNISISALDIIPENFSSTKSISDLIRRSATVNF